MNNIRDRILKEGEIIPLTCDFMFTTILNKEENVILLERFISDYFDIPIEQVRGKVTLQNRELPLQNKRSAKKSVDILLDYDKEKINIELSNQLSSGNIERNIVYLCSIHANQLKKGDRKYQDIHSSIQINLNNFNCHQDNIRESYYFKNEKSITLSKKMRIDIVDLEKGNKGCYTNSEEKLARWCRILKAKSKDELKKEIGGKWMTMEEKEKLYDEVTKLSEEGEFITMFSYYTEEERRRNTYMQEAREEGLASGRQEGLKEGLKEGLEKGIRQGINKGIQKGLEQGLERGIERGKIDMLKKLASKGMNVDELAEISGFNKKMVEKIIKNND